MANVRKPQAIRAATGMNSSTPVSPMGHMMAQGGDNMPAMITDHQGNPQAPTALKQGEIVFSVEAVIGAGNGDYEKGSEILLQLHEKLQEMGKKLLQQHSLAGAVDQPQ